jgi:hypothetical protein
VLLTVQVVQQDVQVVLAYLVVLQVLPSLMQGAEVVELLLQHLVQV